MPLRFWARVALVVAVGIAVVFPLSRTAFALLGVPSNIALVLSGTVVGLFATYVVVAALTQLSGWFATAARVRLLTAIWALLVGVLAAVAGVGVFGMAVGYGVLLGLAAAAVAWPVLCRSTRRGVDVPLLTGRRIQSLEQVDEALRALDRQLADPRLAERARPVVELDRAAALTDRAMLAGRPYHLDEAMEIAERHARHPGYPHHHRFRAACELVAARDLQAQRYREDHGWSEALQLQAAIVGEAGAAEWQAARCAHDQADRYLYLAQEAEPGSAVRAHALRRALELFREALRGLEPGSGFAPLLHTKIANQMRLVARLGGGHRLPDLDHEIDEFRRTLKHYRGRRRTGRELAEIMLARLLLVKVDEEEDLDRGLVEAERLCRRHVNRGPEIRAMAHAVLAEALRLRRELAESPSERADPGLRRARVAHLREAFLAERELPVADATDAGEAWAEAAAELADVDGDLGEVTAACSELACQVPVDVLRRLDERKRVAFVAARQAISTEAGYWLCRAGHLEKAARAVEQARTILLGLLTQRLPDDAEARLRAAGHLGLLEEYEQAVENLKTVERTRYSGVPSDLARLHRAWGWYDRITHLVDDAVGAGPEDGDPLAEARRAAGDGVLVYLGTAQRGSYALVVPPAGPLLCIPLTEVTRSALDSQVECYRAFLAEPGDVDNRLGGVLAWLWTALLDPLLARLPNVSVLTLVPLGELALLPLHAAGTDDVRVDERVAIAYAPSARLVARSGARASRAAPSLAMVSVPLVPWNNQLGELEYAATEASAVARCYGIEPRPLGRVDESLAAMREADVWHLACHGRADLDDPMASYLALVDRRLALREFMASQPGTHRLAVLSACESAIPDRARPDEVIGFPGALLQAGVAGVVASGWRVRQDAAAALSIRFHQLWRTGLAPAVALAGAQRWMRSVTQGELADEFGGGFLPNPRVPPHRLPGWRAQRPFTDARLWAAFSLTGV